MSELSKTYRPQDIEAGIYERWEKSGFFNPDKLPNAKKRNPFVISMPPSNVTGELHIGHALGFTIQDILIRYHRMKGRAALWLPGTDHAAIATQVVVERLLREQGIERQSIGREKFLRHVWAWQKKYGRRINEQTRRMGASADWSRERFTMDEAMTQAVQTAFKKLYDDKLIYRGERIINWCPDCRTAISDLEVDHQETPGWLWYVRYQLVDGQETITIATTRPETMLGDTAVAVHPKDKRYQRLVGRRVRLPIVGREIPVVADDRVDQAFGTGAIKVTPGHDPLDFDIGQTHRLPVISVIGLDGKMTDAAGTDFAGKTVAEARQAVISRLRRDGVLEREEDHIHSVGYCSRSKTVIEPLISLQWFLKTKALAAQAIRSVREGKIEIVPKRFEKVYFHWMEHIRDWNISRQVWWGHRLPVWYRKKPNGRQETKVSLKSPGRGWRQDDDTLDTWFSSGLWTFSTLGWPKKTSDLKRFHPTDVMETAWDILFFWVARMTMLSEYFLHEVPFRTVYLHGLILDREGKKMSKSKGTGVDPLVIADKYGMDALRMSLVVGNAPGQDFRYSEQRTETYRNFANKLWNISRYIFQTARPAGPVRPESLPDAWILSRLQHVIGQVTKHIAAYDFSAAGAELYAFIWHDFADWYLEASKVGPNPRVLYAVLETSLRLLHPFMPFVTETLWQQLHAPSLLMIADWPTTDLSLLALKKDEAFAALQQTVIGLRHFRLHAQLPRGAAGEYVSDYLEPELLQALSGVALRRVPRLAVTSRYKNILLGRVRFHFGSEFVDRFETWRTKERQALERHIADIDRHLGNRRFIDNAPAAIVHQEREKLAAAKQRLLEL